MATWNANVVRIALNQDFWLAASPLYDPGYAPLVDQAVRWAEAAGMDVILDLHWSDAGILGSCAPTSGCQQKMPDRNSVTFWSEVASRYAGDGRVLFELYNEPHDVTWDVWLYGGATGDGWQAAGMQQLYDTVRATGANNLVVIGGLDWAYDLSGVPAHRVDGYNIAYATHPYDGSGSERRSKFWDIYWGSLTATDPVIVTEFGDTTTCADDYARSSSTTPTRTPPAGPPGRGSREAAPSHLCWPTGTQARRRSGPPSGRPSPATTTQRLPLHPVGRWPSKEEATSASRSMPAMRAGTSMTSSIRSSRTSARGHLAVRQ